MIEQFTIFLAIYFMADALHDKYVIEGRKVIDYQKDRIWHLIDSLIKGGVGAYVLYLMGLRNIFTFALFITYLMFFRALWFNFWLNVFRINIGIWHLGKAGIEGWFVKRNLGYLYWILAFVGTVVLYLILIKL